MFIIGKTKLKDDGIYLVGNNADDVTGSCTYIRYNGKQILLECGMTQLNDYLENYRINSEKFKFNPSEIDYVFINHTHVDHIGLLPRLVKEGFNGKIIASHATALLMKPLLLNSCFILGNEAFCLSKKFNRDYKPIYEEDDVYNTLSLIYEYDDLDFIFCLDNTVAFRWFSNSHCVGARQLQLILTDKAGVKKSILYTSDIGGLSTKNHYVNSTVIPDIHSEVVIGESTYGLKQRQNSKNRKKDLEHLRVAINTVLERGGTVLLPAFSFSRSQELLTNLYDIYGNTDWSYDVVIDSLLTCDICNLYDEIITDKYWNTVRSWKNVKYITDKSESLACVKMHNPKVIISSSGFCTNGRILSYLHEYLSDENSMVIFSGYTGNDNSYLSYRIKNYKENKVLKISGDPVANNADCITLTAFSSHANRDDLIKYYSSLNTNKLVLVHGSIEAKNSLKESLKEAISKNNKSFKVLVSNKDMYVKI